MKRKPEQSYSNGYIPGQSQNVHSNKGSDQYPNGVYPGKTFYSGYSDKRSRKPKRKPKWGLITLIACAVLIPLAVYGIMKTVETNRIREEEKRIYSQKVDFVNRYTGVFADNIYIDGIRISGMKPEEAVNLISESLNSRYNTWYLNINFQGHTFITLNYETFGIRYDYNSLNDALNQAYAIGHSGDVETDYSSLTAMQNNRFEFNSNESSMSTELLDTYLPQIAENIALSPTDAYLVSFNPDDSDPFVIQRETYGRYLDTERAKQEIVSRLLTGTPGNYELMPDIVYPSVSESDIRKTVTLIGTAVTPVNAASTENRTNNIRLAFSKFNGYTMDPGDSFSFNKVCGKRTTKNGYTEAMAYVNNESVLEVGGGVCQASSTLYVAARLANLNITHREPHSMAVNYTDYGMDATVNSTGKIIDLTFTNNTSGRIYITARVVDNKSKKQPYRCVVSIYGPAFEEGVTYQMRTEEVETLPGDELPYIYKTDDGTFGLVYTDETKLYKAAVDGHIVAAYLQKCVNGKVIEETQVSLDTYPAQAAVYYRGDKARQ